MIITDARFARSRTIYLSGPRLLLAMSLSVVLVAVGLYHWVFLQGAREGWPVVGGVVRLIARDEFSERDRFMRANLDAMARRVGDMQARVVRNLARWGSVYWVSQDMYPMTCAAQMAERGRAGGGAAADMDELQAMLGDLERLAAQRMDLMIRPRVAPVRSAHLQEDGAHPYACHGQDPRLVVRLGARSLYRAIGPAYRP